MAIQVYIEKRPLKRKKRNGQRTYRYALRWRNPATGKMECESTGTGDKTQAEELQKLRWAELNGLIRLDEPEHVELRPTWQECADALERAMRANKARPSYIADAGIMLKVLHKMFPQLDSPADMTHELANEYKRRRAEGDPERGIKPCSPWTIRGDLATLRAIFGKWLGDECGLLDGDLNPFRKVKPPKCDDPEVRIISQDELELLYAWIAERWSNWRLPAVYLEVADHTGWRATEIASLRQEDILPDGILRVRAEASKTRVAKTATVPAALHEELKAMSTNGMIFGRFSDDLRRRLTLLKQRPRHASMVRDFTPKRLVGWMQDELQRHFEERQLAENRAAEEEGRPATAIQPFTLHDFRRTRATMLQMAGVSEEFASMQLGVTPEVMRRHYARLDGIEIAKHNAALVGQNLPVRARSARPGIDPLDDEANRTQTVSA